MLPFDVIRTACSSWNLTVTEDALRQMDTYARLLVEWNEKMNLTAITDPAEMAVKHFADCLSLLSAVEFPTGASLIDVGTGAGFPGLVLKIVRPDLRITLLDSLQKRLTFLKTVADTLGLSLPLIHQRAEDGGRDPALREEFDFATARAVARMSVLTEYCLPFVKPGGQLLAMKGPDGPAEQKGAETAIHILGGGKPVCHTLTLPGGDVRCILDIKKISQTPTKYPRQGTKITKKPLESR